jgi:hypothetical protein
MNFIFNFHQLKESKLLFNLKQSNMESIKNNKPIVEGNKESENEDKVFDDGSFMYHGVRYCLVPRKIITSSIVADKNTELAKILG